ncbi:IS66 family insertion sequence element accessory protein TnpB [Bordetella bronchialis]|uniref:IS66 family insertion sequence element accessory protein TnpB n=1 Tax=Bordetella bronchialis TaxID=463025 RepID=UPI0009F2CF56|nr:IS66 family insertion sequence element accessory protein TnpB [Bordetella bronchialis]
MFRFDVGLKVYLHREAVDSRQSINGLAALVEQSLGLDPFAAAMYVFRNRRADRIKILLCDRNSFWLLFKRLEKDPLRMAARSSGGDIDRRTAALVTRRDRHRGGATASGTGVSSGGVNAASSRRSNPPCQTPLPSPPANTKRSKRRCAW